MADRQHRTYRLRTMDLPVGIRSTGGRPTPRSSGTRNPLRLQQRLQRVEYEPGPAATWGVYDPHNPARDLIEHALMFRALNGLWGKVNVAVVEVVTTSGEKKIIATESGCFLHSEQRLLAILMETELGKDVAQVTRMFTDLEPCDDGKGCNDCRTTLAGLLGTPNERFCPERIYYAFDYDSGEKVDVIHPDGTPWTETRGESKQDDALGADNAVFEARAEEFRQRAAEQTANGSMVVIDGLGDPGKDGKKPNTSTIVITREPAEPRPRELPSSF